MGPRKELAPWWRPTRRAWAGITITQITFPLIVDRRWRAAENHQRMETMQRTTQSASSENGLSYSVRIDATFGSPFQRSVAIKTLNDALATWKELIEAKHKKNAVTVIRSRD